MSIKHKKLAPIGISTYKRLNHLKKTIESLKNNYLSNKSELYIFSDAPKKGDEKEVIKLRNYLKKIDGFKKIHIIERKINNRVFNNRDGMKQLLSEHGKMIFLEEDIVTAPGFLKFMNDGLNFYKNHSNIISISGYLFPIKIPTNYTSDIIVLNRFNAWGFGTWENKFNKINLKPNKDQYKKNIKNKKFYKKLKSLGDDVPQMIAKDFNNEIDALDVKIMYQQALNNWLTIYPRKSLVQNIGHDGSGIHCGKNSKFQHKELWNKTNNFYFIKNPVIDKKIIKSNQQFRKIKYLNKIKRFLKKMI